MSKRKLNGKNLTITISKTPSIGILSTIRNIEHIIVLHLNIYMHRRIEEYLIEISKRDNQQKELKNQKKAENDRIYKCLVDNLTSLTVNIIKVVN
jgi:hypothetical protein